MRQLPLRLGPRPAPSFESYAVGSNAEALAALRAGPAAAAPTYLWGPAGCGKTHLLGALRREAEARGEPVLAFGPDVPLPCPWDERVRWLLIDDCERLDAGHQQAAFALFVEAAGAGVPVVAAGRLPPVDLPVRDDLRSRLGWGLVFQLRPLTDAEVASVLAHEAARRGIPLGDELIAYLLTRYARDLGSLMALLDALDEFSLAEKRAVTLPLLRRMTSESAASETPA